jgi:hypothetical protein
VLGINRCAHVSRDNRIKIASLLDLAGTKVSVVQVRAEAKDYIDIDALIAAGRIDLPTPLAAGQAIYGRQFNPEITPKALSFFDDGNLRQLSEALTTRPCGGGARGGLGPVTGYRRAFGARAMKPIPLNKETEQVARRVIWFEPPAQALADPIRFIAYAMAHATHDDM